MQLLVQTGEIALSAGTATAAGVGAGTVNALRALALGMTGPVAIAGLTTAAAGATLTGGITARASRVESQEVIDAAVVGMLGDPKEAEGSEVSAELEFLNQQKSYPKLGE